MPHITRKASHHFQKGLNFSENIFKMPRILKNKKAWHSQKKPYGNCHIATMASPPLCSPILIVFDFIFSSQHQLNHFFPRPKAQPTQKASSFCHS
jgi:hypothetical protein